MSDHGIEELLAHAGWLRGLARRLVSDGDAADDLVQETWVDSMRRPPGRAEAPRSWLAKVLLNRLRMRARSEGRRTAREQATVLLADDVPGQDVLVARVEIQRVLVELVLQLDEPYRSTILLHFCEGVPLATIARTQGVPASTVRWRLRTALAQLRERLDAESGGRTQWALPLLAIPKGVLVAHKMNKIIAAVILLIVLLGGGWLFVRHRRGAGEAETVVGAQAGSNHGGGVARRGGVPTVHGADPDRPAWLIQADVKPRRVAGRVVFGGKPVAGATVELASLATESGLGVPLQRTTDAAGGFDFGAQPAMELSVRASAVEHASAVAAVDLRNPALRADHLELVLGACSAAMAGTVRDASGGPIARARIARLDPESQSDVPGGPSVVTDDSGAYEMCVETRWPPALTVEVSAAGYGTINYTAMVPGRVTVDFALVPEATIVGRVIRDDSRAPVAQAYVWVPAGPPGVYRTGWRATLTDATGQFRIDRLAPGRHEVFARADGLAATERGVPVALEAGQTSADIEIRLGAGATLRGTVVEDGHPVAGARVAAGQRVAISQEDGSFVVTGVPYGDIKLSALPYDVVKPVPFHVERPLHDGIVIEVEQLGTITGRVTRGREPAPGAAVYLKGPNQGELDPVVADAEGRYTARGLRAGMWDIAAGSQQVGAFGIGAPSNVQLARGQTAVVDIDMRFAASISGRVIDQNGAPVPSVTVAFVHTAADDIGVTTTSSDGSFRATTMTGGGKYRPIVSAFASLAPSRNPLRPAAGGEFPLIDLSDGSAEVTGIVLAVQLDRLTIAGGVVDEAGAPVPDARVVAEHLDGSAAPEFFQGLQAPASTTDLDGRFSIGDLLSGSYALRARSAAGMESTQTGIRAGRTDVTLVLPSPGAIEATVTGFTGTPQVSALATGIDHFGSPVQGSLQGNVATIRNLSPGSYIVAARAGTEAATALVDVTARRTTRVSLVGQGTAVVAGRLHERGSGKPIEGMTCRAAPRIGTTPAAGSVGDGVRTDAQGAFRLDVPAGDIAVTCDGLWSLFSDGMRMTTARAGQRVDLDVPVVAFNGGAFAGLGADLDDNVLVPRLVRVKPGGPAAAAGLADGDTITAVNGASVTDLSVNGVRLLVRNHVPGTKVNLSGTRGAKTFSADVVLGPLH